MKKDYTVPALAKGLQVLELFHRDREKLSVKDITTALDSTTSQIYRTLHTLEDMGYLEKCEDKKYRLGKQIMHRAFCYLASSEVNEVAVEPMQKLSHQTSATSHLATLSGTEALYQFRVQTHQQLVPNFPVGSRLPAHQCAVGRMLLSHLSTEKITALYQNVTLDNSPEDAPQSLPELLDILAKDKAQQYATSTSHYAKAIAVPIFDYRGEVVAAVNISSIHLAIDEGDIQTDTLKALQYCANTISEKMGGYGYFSGLL